MSSLLAVTASVGELEQITHASVDWINVAEGRDKCYDHGTKLQVA